MDGPVLASRCTRCARPSDWTVCTSCRPGRVESLDGTNASAVCQCAICRLPLSVPPRYYHAAAHVLLCPRCQTRPPHHRGQGANPYPVAYTYPDLPQRADSDDRAPRLCMRFGCGARLLMHTSGETCEACATAGFVRPPPSASAQTRFASLDAVGATEGKDGDSESEIELVYPDDIPVATPALEDEDVEPELVYPEDAATTQTMTPSSKPRTKPPTTLRELFAGGLHSIPTLQYPTALADKSPPRRCRMPGCDEVLPPRTCMERCVKCGTADWKRRKLASIDSFDPSWRPSTSSLDTTMEEKQSKTMFDEVSDVEDENAPPLRSSSPSKSGSSNGPTSDHAVRPIPGWNSDLTELSSSDPESESASDFDPDPHSEPVKPHEHTPSLTIYIPLLVNRLPPDSPRKKCGNKRCNIALPKDHRWKTCDPCRRAHRAYQRMRLDNIRRNILDIEMLASPEPLCRRWRSLSPELEMRDADASLTPETSRPCAVRHCERRIPLPEVYRWKTCVGCRASARREARRKHDARVQCQHGSWVGPPEVVPRFQAYQNRGQLLASFGAHLREFVESQIMYSRARLLDGGDAGSASLEPKHVPTIFVFVGEYSIVTGQRGENEREEDRDCEDARPLDDPSAPEAMRQEVSSVVLELERALRTKFSAGEAFAIDQGGMIMRFTCSLELIAQLRPLTTGVGPGPGASSTPDSEAGDGDKETSREEAVPLVKTLSGELEAVVVPDESHSLFHGQRTLIRYCMFG